VNDEVPAFTVVKFPVLGVVIPIGPGDAGLNKDTQEVVPSKLTAPIAWNALHVIAITPPRKLKPGAGIV
jgi:hypothetical protein